MVYMVDHPRNFVKNGYSNDHKDQCENYVRNSLFSLNICHFLSYGSVDGYIWGIV